MKHDSDETFGFLNISPIISSVLEKIFHVDEVHVKDKSAALTHS